LLDEPEAALSPARQLALLRIIKDLEKEAQFIIATHSPILLGYPNAQILDFDAQPVRETRYEDTAHYIVTRRFLENRKKVLEELFSYTVIVPLWSRFESLTQTPTKSLLLPRE